MNDDGLLQVRSYIVKRDDLCALTLMARGGRGCFILGSLNLISTEIQYTLNIDGLYMHFDAMELTYYEGIAPFWMLQLVNDQKTVGKIYLENLEDKE